MKKYILLTALALIAFTGTAQRRNADRLFSEFSSEAGVTAVKVNNVPDDVKRMLGEGSKVDFVEVLAFNDAAPAIRERASQAIGEFSDSRFETWVSGSSNGGSFKVLALMNGEKVSEVLVLVTGDNTVMVRLKGELNRSHLENISASVN